MARMKGIAELTANIDTPVVEGDKDTADLQVRLSTPRRCERAAGRLTHVLIPAHVPLRTEILVDTKLFLVVVSQ